MIGSDNRTMRVKFKSKKETVEMFVWVYVGATLVATLVAR
jgi:hypothetical protein